ncbi:MAG: 30S ribosomal protein S1 [Anaerolineales bacterium]
MVTRSQERSSSPNFYPWLDEKWWESVLAEEAQFFPPKKSTPPLKVDSRFERLRQMYLHDEILTVTVTATNRGGLLIEGEGFSGFIPFSHLVNITPQMSEEERQERLKSYLGQTLRVKLIECNPEEERLIFSERAAEASPGQRLRIFKSIKVGQRVRGRVTNITDFGIFVDLGGVEGLVHISELSWGRVIHPSHHAQYGQELELLVIDISPERCRIALSLKRLLPNPWEEFTPEKVLDRLFPATITSLLSYGAFARLENGLEGLIHISQMPLAEGQSIRDLLHEGQQVQVRVIHVEPENQRMGLSLLPVPEQTTLQP